MEPTRRPGPELAVWPWSARVAVLLVPAVLLVLLVTLAITRSVSSWPSEHFEGWVLLAIIGLSLLPVILLLLQMLVTRGGTFKVAGLSLSFTQVSEAVASSVRVTTLAENLGTTEGAPVNRSSLSSIIRALRRAHDSEVTVVDLRQGRTWWETRLFILVAGAARRGRPAAIAFIADRNGRPGSYVGWASPSRLLDMHTAAVPRLGEAYQRAVSKAAQWQIGTPPPLHQGPVLSVKLPWNETLYLPPVENEMPDASFALELFLQQELDIGTDDQRVYVGIQRLLELYEPVLMTDSVDVGAEDRTWARMLASTPRRYFALTSADVFKSVVPRDSLLAALVVRLVESGNRVTGPEGH